MSKDWNTDVRVKTCGWCDKSKKPIIHMPWGIHVKVVKLSEKIKTLEWLGYLAGEQLSDGSYRITGITVPEQVITGSSVHVTDPQTALGTVHLHPMGGTFLSGIDDESIGGNHELTLSVNNNGQYKANVKRILPCGSSFLVEAEVVVAVPQPKDLEEFIEKALEKMTEYKAPPVASAPVHPGVAEYFDGTQGKWVKTTSRATYCAKCHKPVPIGDGHWRHSVMYCEKCVDQVDSLTPIQGGP